MMFTKSDVAGGIVREKRHNLSPAELPFGATCHVEFTKWDATPHWHHETVVLGEDSYGIWVGGAPGGLSSKPGGQRVASTHWVNLFPRDDMWVATFNAEGEPAQAAIYVDVSTVPSWWHRPDGILEVSAVDLDLDVIRRSTGEVYLDDEEEFEEHSRVMEYPEEIIAGARDAADRLLRDIEAFAEPFDQVGAGWLALCRRTFSQGAAPAVSAGASTHISPADLPHTSDEQPGAVKRPAVPAPSDTTDWLSTWQHSVLTGGDSLGQSMDQQADGLSRDPDTQPLPVVPTASRDELPESLRSTDHSEPTSFAVGEARSKEHLGKDGQDGQDGQQSAAGWEVEDVRSIDVEWSIDAGSDIDTTPIDPADVTGLLLTTSEADSPLWFDGQSVTPAEVGIPDELADYLYDWLDLWRRDWDPVRGWAPRARISDYEALGRWLARRVKDEVGVVVVTLQLGHLGVSSLKEIAGPDERVPIPVTLDPSSPQMPVDGEFVTREGVVGCFTSEVNMRLSAWAEVGGSDSVEEARLADLMTCELGPDYIVLRSAGTDDATH